VPGVGAVVAGRILATTAGELGRGRQLGQHSEVGDPLEAHQGGKTHQSRPLDSGDGSTERLFCARP
jgi:hypothetical protein